MSDYFTVVVIFLTIIGLLVLLIGSFAWIGTKAEIAKMKAEVNLSDRANLIEENKSIRHRLEVLEAIITDKDYELHEKLRVLK